MNKAALNIIGNVAKTGAQVFKKVAHSGHSNVFMKTALTLTPIAALGLFAASCQDEINQEQNTKITLPSDKNEELEEIKGYVKELVEQGKATAVFQKAMLTAIANVTSLIQKGIYDLQEYNKLVIESMRDDKDLQKQILAELKAQGKSDAEARAFFAEKVDEIIGLLNSGSINLMEAIDLLRNISDHVTSIDEKMDTVISQLSTLNSNVDSIKQENAAYHKEALKNGAINNELLGIGNKQREKQIEIGQKTYEAVLALKDGVDELIKLGNEKPDELIKAVYAAIEKGEDIANRLGWTLDMNAKEIIKTLNDFKEKQLAWNERFYEIQVENNKLFKSYLPLLKNLTDDNKKVLDKLEKVISAINKNTDVTEDAVKAQEETNKLLRELIAKADPFIDGVNRHMNNVEQNWKTLLPLINAAKQQAGEQRQALIDLINNYGPKVINYLDSIKANTDSLNVIGGSQTNPLTASDIDQLLTKFGNTYQKPIADLLKSILDDMKNLDRDNDGLWLEKIEKHVNEIEEILSVDEGVH